MVPAIFYGLPQIYKQDSPLRPIVSSRASITYSVTKELANILQPLAGCSHSHIRNTQHFVEQIKSIHLQQRECMSSYGVKALFTSVPVNPAINIIHGRLQQDPLLSSRTSLSIQNIITHFDISLRSTFLCSKVRITNRYMGWPWTPP